MANPQPSDAHLRVAHKIQEQIMVSLFTEQQGRILDLIFRLSWGCGKKEATIPLQSDFEVCGVGRTHVGAHIDWLVDAKVVTKNGTSYSIQKDYDQWRVSRAKGYTKQKLFDLVALNLNGNYIPPESYGKRNPKPEKQVTESVTPSDTEEVTESVTPLATNSASLKKKKEKGNLKEKVVSLETVITGGEIIGVNDFWDTCLEILKDKVSQANFNTWLKDTKGLSFDGDTLILKVPSNFIAAEIIKRLEPVICKTLSEAVGKRMGLICEVVND